jgi:hypothetical protein
MGACIAQNYYRNGSLWASNWFCEQAEKAGLFPASRQGTTPLQASFTTNGNAT